MFELVADVPSYPQFMPWCGGARLLDEPDGRVRATIDINYRGIRSGFTTLNRHRETELIEMEFADGPFSSLAGRWQFAALDEAACKVEFALDYEFAGSILGRMIAPVFDVIAASFIDAFSSRAENIYG
jgi:ribosome-associated toxin RatA of RatAB toxin-antitoxin module